MVVTLNKYRSRDIHGNLDGWYFTVRPSARDRRAVAFEITRQEFKLFRGRFRNVLNARIRNAKDALERALNA